MFKFSPLSLVSFTVLCVSIQAVAQHTGSSTDVMSDKSVSVILKQEPIDPTRDSIKSELLSAENRGRYRGEYVQLKNQIQELRNQLDESLKSALMAEGLPTLEKHSLISARHREEHFDDYVRLEELQVEASALGEILNTDLLHFNSIADADSVKIARDKLAKIAENNKAASKTEAENKVNELILKHSYNASTE